MLTCHQYDYIEIICMYQYPVTFTLRTGEKVQCKALDTQLNEQREECIKVEIAQEIAFIVLSHIQAIDVMIENPNFTHISFE